MGRQPMKRTDLKNIRASWTRHKLTSRSLVTLWAWSVWLISKKAGLLEAWKHVIAVPSCSENYPEGARGDFIIKGAGMARAGLAPYTSCFWFNFILERDDVEAICFFLRSSVTSQACIIFLTKCLFNAGITKGAGIVTPEVATKLKNRGEDFFFFNPTSHVTFSFSFSWEMTSVHSSYFFES